MTESADIIVIGAGVVGLAIGRAFAQVGRDVIVLEKNAAFGEETSARNSEVIHAGLYYKAGGYRARFCHPGKLQLYEFCRSHHVSFDNCQKLIVAFGDDEIARLRGLQTLAKENGVTDLEHLSRAEARALEPALECDAALLSPSTGIVDSHGLMLALLGEMEDAGGMLALNAPVESGQVHERGTRLNIGGADAMEVDAKLVVNAAGLWSDRVARSIDGIPAATFPSLHYGKGQYFTYSGAAPFARLIYPVPGPDSLGAHYTRDLGGQAKLGPDLTYVQSNTDYEVDPARRDGFASSVRRFWPDLDPERLQPGYAGIRPKCAGMGEEGDFNIQGREAHGIASYIGLYGIESPGLTSCLAIADYVVGLTA